MKEVRTIYLNMKPTVRGFVVRMFDDGEDYDTIVINPCYNWEQQQKTYKHELEHIEARDLEGYCDPNTVERLRHYGNQVFI